MPQPILTPDRRLRVFVSSTLRELAAERAVVREAVSSLRLSPILFEHGARPHAPRDLYAAYVGQCDVFVGVYWQSYGWVAPGAQISGLEDELDLAQGKPMLLYVKEPAPEREERMSALIRRVEERAGTAYRTFATTEELQTLVLDDLALLLTERFHTRAVEPDERLVLPARTTSFIGRDSELEELLDLVGRPDVRLVTLTGPGGIGKTRLALEAARRLAPSFRDGAAYVALERIADAELVPQAIADAFGLSSLGPDQEAGLARRLRDRHVLLVLDNFEHVLAAAPLVTRLLEEAGGLEVVATSRERLRLQGEQDYGVPPLADAPALFMDRVRAVRPDVVWDEDNVQAANEICRRVDGLPLAVELVAAGSRLLAPRALVEYLESSLDPPATGRRDAPARQQTVRATIDWSYALLTAPERDLFERLGVFASSFTIEAAAAVAEKSGRSVLSTLAALVDKSLVAHVASESETRFRMLQVVSEYAGERLRERTDENDIRAAHAAYYLELGDAAGPGLRSSQQRGWKEVLDLERENVRRALEFLPGEQRVDEAADLVWSVWPYWLAGHFLEGRRLTGALVASRELSGRARARLLTVDGILAALLADLATAHTELAEALEWFDGHDDTDGKASALGGLGIATAPFDPDRARQLMLESARLFAENDDVWGEAIVLGALGWLDTGRGDFAREEHFQRAYELARLVDDEVATAHGATNLVEYRIAWGRLDEARAALEVALAAHEAVRLYDGLSYALEAAARLSWNDGRPVDVARLLGAADGLRKAVEVPIWGPRLSRFEAFVGSAREALGEEGFGVAWAEGQALGFESALEAARRMLHPSTSSATS